MDVDNQQNIKKNIAEFLKENIYNDKVYVMVYMSDAKSSTIEFELQKSDEPIVCFKTTCYPIPEDQEEIIKNTIESVFGKVIRTTKKNYIYYKTKTESSYIELEENLNKLISNRIKIVPSKIWWVDFTLAFTFKSGEKHTKDTFDMLKVLRRKRQQKSKLRLRY